MAVTLCADLGLVLQKLLTVEWETISSGKSLKKGMTIYYRCESVIPYNIP